MLNIFEIVRVNFPNGPLFVAMFLFLLVKPQQSEPNKIFWSLKKIFF
jgi:hypothetical protein